MAVARGEKQRIVIVKDGQTCIILGSSRLLVSIYPSNLCHQNASYLRGASI